MSGTANSPKISMPWQAISMMLQPHALLGQLNRRLTLRRRLVKTGSYAIAAAGGRA